MHVQNFLFLSYTTIQKCNFFFLGCIKLIKGEHKYFYFLSFLFQINVILLYFESWKVIFIHKKILRSTTVLNIDDNNNYFWNYFWRIISMWHWKLAAEYFFAIKE